MAWEIGGAGVAPVGTAIPYASDPIVITTGDGVTGTVLAATYGFSKIIGYTAYFTATGKEFTIGDTDYTGGNFTWTNGSAADFTLTVWGTV